MFPIHLFTYHKSYRIFVIDRVIAKSLDHGSNLWPAATFFNYASTCTVKTAQYFRLGIPLIVIFTCAAPAQINCYDPFPKKG
jgi:hypothetical protein